MAPPCGAAGAGRQGAGAAYAAAAAAVLALSVADRGRRGGATAATARCLAVDGGGGAAPAKPEELRWENDRSPRGRAMVSDSDVACIALMINDLVDLPYWDEEEEQELFNYTTSKCVEVIAEALPIVYFKLLYSKEGFGREDARELETSLVRLCRSNCDLPFLDEQDRRRVIRGVVWALVASMQEGRDLSEFTTNLQDDPRARLQDARTQEIIVNVFMQGALDVFFEADLRRALASNMASLIKEVPFVPGGLVERCIDHLLLRFTGSLQTSLRQTFQEYRTACAEGRKLPLAPAEIDSESEREHVLELYKAQPFVIQLRRTFIMQIMDDCFGDRRLLRLLEWPHVWVLSRFVDSLFGHLPGVEKIEHSLQVLHADELDQARPVADAARRQPDADEDVERRMVPGLVSG